ncbi:glycosyltransferase [Halomonas denitrificans]|uniref:glycosyltransferase n=1 Tax=Halomonas denitrificans TaxID=370769 RepID=UPI001C99CFA2|nr:glycosyltransferase [Halomonas denitrificans]MBY5969543.1 glycosyltransferase [Halomonas denitrificans]
MRIVLLAAASSIHTVRWANSLCEAGNEVFVISQHQPNDLFNSNVRCHYFPFRGGLGYFLMARRVKRLLRSIKPDIVNAHYASGYGTTARLTDYHPLVLSVWGSDVYDFPEKSCLHKRLVQKNLLAADRVASTSHCMAERTLSLCPELKTIAITPFGVDIEKYELDSNNLQQIDASARPLVIGTVKTMADKYGIDTLITAFSQVRKALKSSDPELAERLHLRLIGDGPKLAQLRLLAAQEGVSDVTSFLGRVPHSSVPRALAELDIYVALSRFDSESFGVAIIEASAAGLPVIVSDAGGLPEVVKHGETGFVVPRENPSAAAKVILDLIYKPDLMKNIGIAGREHVSSMYNWHTCVEAMERLYSNTIGEMR